MRPTKSIFTSHDATPKGRGLTSSILFLCVLRLCAYGQSEAPSEFSDQSMWSARRTIASVPATNTAYATEPYVHPAVQAIAKLNSGQIPASTNESLRMERHISALGEGLHIDEDTLDERVEFRRVQVLLQELESLNRQVVSRDYIAAQMEEMIPTLRHNASLFLLHHRLGALYFREQNYSKAAHHMEEALTIQPNNSAIASNLAAAQMTLGQLDDALETLNSIQVGLVDSNQLLFSIYFNKACLYSLKERTEEAIENLIRAAESDPPSVYASLGDPQLDFIRDDMRFKNVQFALESMLRAQ